MQFLKYYYQINIGIIKFTLGCNVASIIVQSSLPRIVHYIYYFYYYNSVLYIV